MRKLFVFLLAIAITGIISGAGACPEVVGPSEIEIRPVIPVKKTAITRPFFRLEGMFKVTNYIPEENAITCTGEIAKWGIVAVNPKEIPLGSVIYIADFPGQKFIANDTIGKRGIEAGVKIDVCRNFDFSLKDAKEFGGDMRKVIVIIKKPLAG